MVATVSFMKQLIQLQENQTVRTLTIIVENDFEFIEEYGWELVWSDEFNGDDLSDLLWTNQNASVSGGNLTVGVNESSGLVESNEIFHHGRFEVKLKSPNPLDFYPQLN
ncbi:MAG: hypothetical protein CM15mP51_09190 [Porticoccaceae bacterium]|nr:MAG: hypothetical protein CM15mP51_09190 [Porticoccaceae bacterium]